MGVRKNAKFLTATERENFVKACVLMKADIVNSGAPAADQYSKWDEAVAIHRMIQSANAPGATNVNFGHGGLGAYSFLSWHRYFLYRFEQQLQSYVPGVMLPYWDWTDPAPLMTDTFLGPDGSGGLNIVGSGYFAPNAPGTAGSPTPAPAWWPAGLSGWNLPNGFGALTGPLKRDLSLPSSLPSVTDLRTTLSQTTYSSFQNMLESGSGLTSSNHMHNGIHGWVGGHMSSLTGSPFDPLFYLHHCNIDRLWAMWQMDDHATLYPAAGAKPKHGPTDAMYPWVGADAALYTSNYSFGSIVMPNFLALGMVANIDTLDHRALGYTYDTLAVIGIGLDRTGSMNGLTPDPMTGSGTVSKWEAAKRGVSAFLQDCETVQNSAAIYVMAGIKTFRSTVSGNDFAPVFPGTPYGLVKNGTAYSKGTFDSTIASMIATGGTPLADALQDIEDTLVEPPFGWVPTDEQRYLAILTDGMLTSGSPMSSIADGSFSNTAVFAMGFGTPVEVDYPTLASMVAKGKSLAFTQVFHGENAGTIDKFYSNALARAIGFTTVFDPVLELFAGEHTHVEFSATSADESFFLTVQGMDFDDTNWGFQLVGPDGNTVYTEGIALAHAHGGGNVHGGRMPNITAAHSNGRLSLMLQRDSADGSTWVGTWMLKIAYRANDMSSMVMPDIGELMFPVAAGPIRGARYANLLLPVEKRLATRSVSAKSRHQLDVRPGSTNNDMKEACSVVVNIYARTRLRLELLPQPVLAAIGDQLKVLVDSDVLSGNIVSTRALARLVAPAQDISAIVSHIKRADIPKAAMLKGSKGLHFDPAMVLAVLEKKKPNLAQMRDEEKQVISHENGPLHVHLDKTEIPGVHHFGVYVEGAYCPEHSSLQGDHNHNNIMTHNDHSSECGPQCSYERFTRLLNASVAVVKKTKSESGTNKKRKKKSHRAR